MRVAVWHNNRDIRLEEAPRPKPGPKEMLVKVMACGICGSDIVEWYRLPRAPLVQGHELGAEVVEAGREVRDYKRGDRVMVAPKVACLECRYCREGHFPVCPNVKVRLPGGFAEYILVPEELVEKGTYRLPEGMTYDQATFIEPLACVVRAQNIAGLRKGQSVLIMGCGMSGLLHVKLAKAKGCRVAATDVVPGKLELARRNGADLTIGGEENAASKLAAEWGRPADAVIVCTSAMSAVGQAWTCADKGGAVVFFAVPGPDKTVAAPLNDYWTKEMRILTSYYCGPPDIKEAIALLAAGVVQVEDMITHRLPLADIARGFALALDGRESIKIIIRPHEGT